MASKRILLLEPFYGGSHRQLIDFLHNVILQEETDAVVDKVVMSDKKWHWRMRTSALYFAEHIEETASPYRFEFMPPVNRKSIYYTCLIMYCILIMWRITVECVDFQILFILKADVSVII